MSQVRDDYNNFVSIALKDRWSAHQVLVSKEFDAYTRSLLESLMAKLSEPSRQLGEFVTRQQDISLTRYLHGFNTSDIAKDLDCMQGEVDEVRQAISDGEPADRVVEELADVAIYCYGMAQMLGVDLDGAIFKKMAYNVSRTYPSDLDI